MKIFILLSILFLQLVNTIRDKCVEIPDNPIFKLTDATGNAV